MSVKDTWTGKCEPQDQPATRDPSNKQQKEKQALTKSRASVQGPLAPHSADMVWVALLRGGLRAAARGRGGEERGGEEKGFVSFKALCGCERLGIQVWPSE